MDRAGRRFFIASSLIAVPMVLLMASLSIGDSPASDLGAVEHAIPQPTADEATHSSPIQQVAGTQIESRKTRPGLLQVLAGSAPSGDKKHRHKNMGNTESRGLLNTFFGSSKQPAHKQNHNQHSKHRRSTRSSQQPAKSKSNVNWDGIPYHAPAKMNSHAGRVPVQDPSSQSVASRSSVDSSDQTKIRIIRGGSSKITNARPASARTRTSTRPVRREATTASLPKPPADLTQEPKQAAKISSITSSRRSDRRDLRALEASIQRKPTNRSKQAATESKADAVALVPRVAAQPAEVPKPVEAHEAVVATAQAATDQVAESATNKTEKSAGDTVTPAPNTALAAIGKPTVAAEPKSAAEVVPGDPAGNSEVSGDYTVPVDPAPVPTAGIPKHPYAASTPQGQTTEGSTPASVASHRAGPPSSAFGASSSSTDPASDSDSPIGSGVVPRGDVPANGQASEPAFQTARLPGSASDPYGSRTESPSNRLTTNGQPIESGAAPATTATGNSDRPANFRHTHDGISGVPMHSIPGHHSAMDTSTNQGSSDNFDRSTYETRNQMRGATANSGLSNTVGPMATTSELPGIRVVTHGPSSIMIRQTSQFEIRVENRGSIDANGVLVRSTVPDWAELGGQNASVGNVDVREQGSSRLLVWTIDHLPAGTSERMFVRLTAARSGSYDLDVDWTLLPQKAVAKVTVREPRLDLTIEGPDEVVYGQSQTYKVHVLNPGDGTAPNVVFTLSPNSATPQTQRIGDIPPGKEAQFDVELTAQDLGDLKIHGLAMGEYDLRAEESKTIRVSAAQLEAMLNGPELKYQNSDASYNLQVQNTGSVVSEKIMATLRLPAGVEYVGGIEGVSPQGNMLRWEITSLPPGATRNYQFRCKMTSTGEHTFAFDCKGTAAGITDVSISTQVESIADLVLTVNDPVAPAPIGSDVTYEIVIRNRGSKEATDVRAVAQFSHGIEPQRIEGQSGEVVTGQVLFDPIVRIGAGQEVRLRVIAQADRGGHHRFRSEVRSGDTVLVAEEATHYMSPKSERVSRHSSNSTAR